MFYLGLGRWLSQSSVLQADRPEFNFLELMVCVCVYGGGGVGVCVHMCAHIIV